MISLQIVLSGVLMAVRYPREINHMKSTLQGIEAAQVFTSFDLLCRPTN